MREPIDSELVYKVGCGKKHGRYILADGYIDSRVSASRCQSMSTTTDDNMRSSKRIKTLINQIVDLESKMGEMHRMLIVSLLTIMI
jgi:hypothetical protein